MARIPIMERASIVVCRGPQEVFRVDPVKVVEQFWLDQASYVEGVHPFCDACGKFLLKGDRIRVVWIRDPGTKWANKRERRVHADCLRRAS